jgi:hypothetical protein
MKSCIVFVFSAALLAAADAPAKKVDPPPTPVKLLQVPAGAVEIRPGSYRFVDSDGKAWVYRKTPFGVVRAAESQTAAPTTAKEDGDTIRFERPTPFGVDKWQKKKSELNSNERAIWEAQQAHSADPQK